MKVSRTSQISNFCFTCTVQPAVFNLQNPTLPPSYFYPSIYRHLLDIPHYYQFEPRRTTDDGVPR